MRDRLGRVATTPVWLLAGGMAVSAALLLALGSRLTFLLDDWEFLLYRPGFTAHAILDPHVAASLRRRIPADGDSARGRPGGRRAHPN
jgi:hypothetical protein